jgi:hypothetical protein
LLLVAGATFLALALASVRVLPFDPSAATDGWVGPAGAVIARTLVVGFGVAAWLVPIELCLFAVPLFKGRPQGDLGLRLAGDLVLLIVVAALVQVAAPGAVAFGHAAAGGNVGLLFGELMREFFSAVGSFLIGPTIVGLILIGRSSFSFIEACHRALALLRLFAARLTGFSRRVSSAWREARSLRRAERAREAEARAPHIEMRHPDEAILLHLADDGGDWIPIERTGAPPLAISQALKHSRGAELAALLEATPLAAPVAPGPSEEPAGRALKGRPWNRRGARRSRSRANGGAGAPRSPPKPQPLRWCPRRPRRRSKPIPKRRPPLRARALLSNF